MLGGIYTEEKCPICGRRMKDNHRDGVSCQRHPKQRARSLFVKFGRKFYRRFVDYNEASRVLTGLRFKHDEGTYDPRDYQKGSPLGIDKQIEKYLQVKEITLKPGSLRSLRPHIRRIQNWFGPLNVKSTGYAEIEDFLIAQKDISDKTRHNLRSILHDFFSWLVRRKILRKDQIPDFPEVRFELGYRRTIDKATQELVLEEIKRLTWNRNPRIYIGVKWAATYINTRPGELLGILEEDIDYDRGIIFIRKHKTSKQEEKIKVIPLVEEDIALLRSLPRGFPKMPFFRRDRGGGGQPAGKILGRDMFYHTWKAACKNLGIDGVDLYGGTRHSSAQALRKLMSAEGIRRLTDHATNRAFERYYQKSIEEMREGYELARPKSSAPPLHHRKPVSHIPKTGSEQYKK